MKTKASLELDVYGCGILITGGPDTAVGEVAEDFEYFRKKHAGTQISVELLTQEPPYGDVPHGVATVYTPRNVSLKKDDRVYIDYAGRALGIWDMSERVFRLYSTDLDLQYEATYLFLLAQIGERLDKAGMHRIHAMAMAVNGRAVVAIMPMGGGKSTLTHGLLRYPEYSFLSDDSPFISADGTVHAFPLRLGFLPGSESESDFPPEQTRVVKRMEFGPKVLVNYSCLADRVLPSADPGIVFLGKRSFSNDCRIEPVGIGEKYQSMVANCVVGLGLFQGLEFLLNHKPMELVSKFGVSWSRLRNARKLFARSQVYRLILGRDQQHNASTVREFVNKSLG